MQWLAEVCVRRPVFAVMLVLALATAGGVSFFELGIDRFPKVDFPTVFVRTTYPGAAAEEMETEISQLIEDAVSTVEGIDELRSISSEGTSTVLLTFRLDRDVNVAAQDVRDAINSVLNQLPVGTLPPTVGKRDTDDSPILTMAVSGDRTQRELYELAELAVKDIVESAAGVGEVRITGASQRAINVNIEAARLAAYGMSILQVREALTRQNVEVPGGRLDEGTRELNLRTQGRFSEARDFADMVVATVGNQPIRLRDIGTAVDGEKERRSIARIDGKPAVLLSVYRQSGSNTVQVIQGVKDRLPRSESLLPDGVKVEIVQDQSRYIKAALHEIENHLVIGSFLASIVVLFFMKSWRSTIIAAIAIPTSLIATFAVMKAFNFTLNNITMLALVLMVGVVIDDAIVVLENIFHCMEEKGMSPFEAAIEGTREIGLAVLATTISLVIVFLPVSFLSSLTGRFLFEFGITASAAVLVSMLVSFSLTPMMCARMLKIRPGQHGEGQASHSRRGFYALLERVYLAMLGWALRHRVLTMIFAILVVATNIPLYGLIRQDYVPTNVDESEFEIGVTAPDSVNFLAMDKAMGEAEREIGKISGIEHIVTSVGTSGLGALSSGTMFIRLVDTEERVFSLGRLFRALLAGRPGDAFAGNFSQREKMQECRKALARFGDFRISVRNLTSLRTGPPVDIDFVVLGPDLPSLAECGLKFLEKSKSIPGLVDQDITLRVSKPDLNIRIDRERAANMGIDVRQIAETLRVAIGGDDRVSRFRDPKRDEVYDVELRLVGIDRNSSESLNQLYVPAPGGGGGVVRLDNLVSYEESLSPARIDRLDRQRSMALRANIAPGYALSDRIQALHETYETLEMPQAYSTKVSGRGKELERTVTDMSWALMLSLIFMYIVLAAQFEHLAHPITILASLPLAVPFGLFSLWLGDETLNLYSALGILVLFGVIKKNSILQVEHTNQLRAKGMERTRAILQANRDRLRPILMTTLSFVAGMLPLIIGTGPGAEERRSIAVLVVGGQTLSLGLTLLVTPVLYSVLDDLGRLWKQGDVPAQAAAAQPLSAQSA